VSVAAHGPAISTKNKHLLAIYSIPTRGFTAAVSVFRGTPPPKPFDCKVWLNTSGALLLERWTESTGRESRLSCARLDIVLVDIIEMPLSFCSQMIHLWLCVHIRLMRTTKNPARTGRAGFEKVCCFFTCLPPVCLSCSGRCHDTTQAGQGQTRRLGCAGHDVSLSRPSFRATFRPTCSCRYSSNAGDD